METSNSDSNPFPKGSITAAEMGRRGGLARARNHPQKLLAKWSRKGGLATAARTRKEVRSDASVA